MATQIFNVSITTHLIEGVWDKYSFLVGDQGSKGGPSSRNVDHSRVRLPSFSVGLLRNTLYGLVYAPE